MTDDVGYDQVVRSTMAELTSTFAKETAVEDALGRVTAAAVDLIEGIDYADVLLIDGHEFRSVMPTSPIMTQLDSVQRELQEGPCLEAAVADAVIRSPDVKSDPRWPRFGAAAAEVGVGSVLSYQLYTHKNGVGALNLFGRATGPSIPKQKRSAPCSPRTRPR